MKTLHPSRLDQLLESTLGVRAHRRLRESLAFDPLLERTGLGSLSRAEVAMGLAAVLFEDLCDRVPLAAAYARESAAAGRPVVFDHGAVRCVAAPSGELPEGRRVIARLLEPLGYVETRRYDLDRLGMTGYSYTHADLPEAIPQFFVSELHPESFSPALRDAVHALVATSVDPLTDEARGALATLSEEGRLEPAAARALLPVLRRCFERQHRNATLEEYELFAAESPEMAWISTEGHAFNHITDRVDDVDRVAQVQRDLGRPVKDRVEISRSGRVVQTALRAAQVERLLWEGDRYVPRTVAGSFLEFISRERDEAGRLDLAFDAANAQGIFKMTDGVAR